MQTGRLVRMSVEILDVPGELARAAQCVADNGANVVQVNHQRIFTELPVQSTELQFVLQTRGPEHVREIVSALDRADTIQDGPVMIAAHTVKGKGVPFAENNAAFHNGVMTEAQYEEACSALADSEDD